MSWWKHWDEKQNSKASGVTVSTYGGAGSFARCGHWRTPVIIGGHEVWASGLFDRPHQGAVADEPAPDVGFYLDDSWLPHLGAIAAVGTPSPMVIPWPFVLVAWPDMKAMPIPHYAALVAQAILAMQQGKRIEVACLGGHGRTGTMLAALVAHFEKKGAKDAIALLRERYCQRAVESMSQTDAVYELLGEPLPPLPKPKKTAKIAGKNGGATQPSLLPQEPLYYGDLGDGDWSGLEQFKSTERQFDFDEEPDWPAAFDRDLCECGCPRSAHRNPGARCGTCGVNCGHFALQEIVN